MQISKQTNKSRNKNKDRENRYEIILYIQET